MGVLLHWVRVHSSWPWLSCADSSSGRISVFVCSVLCCLSQRAGEPAWFTWVQCCSAQNEADCTISLPYITVIVVGRSSCEPKQVHLTLSLSLTFCQCVTAKAPVKPPPPPPSVTTVATRCLAASPCSSRCLREDWTTATVCCHLTPRWWVNTPGPSWPQIR